MIDKLRSMSMTDGMFGSDPEEAICAICLGDYAPAETIRFLPCQHHFHLECVDQWLLTDKSCPLCKHDIDRPVTYERSGSRFTIVYNITNNNTNSSSSGSGGSSSSSTAPRRNEDESEDGGGGRSGLGMAAGIERFQVIVL
ncbi:hypothetical protein BC939DRAFT_459044 [Gamsiella multidivaricata]|uniref:uncharacterized protein n=1 Tax=Gamsiella multidivaricata TaxID=101098 RepID=UPI00221EF9C7|nr:uncharacterized protein BC939DRAFT_459044 [Gamsiella multidivaricata]KAI7819934.1 hypothetical protein BC939DRAFT_459044 [Gamsiella multidivaricata]